MTFVPKKLERTADASRSETSLGDIAKSIAGLVALAVVGYWVLGWIAGMLATRVSPTTESRLAHLVPQIGEPVDGYEQELEKAQQLLERLLADADLRPLDYRVEIVDLGMVNAFAMPGGRIGLTSQLVDEIETEQELAMVLGHELGHFAQRDHLRRLGRGLLLSLGLTVLGQGDLGGFLQPFAMQLENQYGRSQEEGADRFGLELLVEAYGHAGGATRFFERMELSGGDSRLTTYLSTHPAPGARSERLEGLIEARGYAVSEETSWLGVD